MTYLEYDPIEECQATDDDCTWCRARLDFGADAFNVTTGPVSRLRTVGNFCSRDCAEEYLKTITVREREDPGS